MNKKALLILFSFCAGISIFPLLISITTEKLFWIIFMAATLLISIVAINVLYREIK